MKGKIWILEYYNICTIEFFSHARADKMRLMTNHLSNYYLACDIYIKIFTIYRQRSIYINPSSSIYGMDSI